MKSSSISQSLHPSNPTDHRIAGFFHPQSPISLMPSPPKPCYSPDESDEPFDAYLWRWLQVAKSTIAITTYSSYFGMLRNPICPWFQKRGVTLKKLTAKHIQDFYTAQLRRVCPNTVIHYHTVIHRALKYAVKTDLLPTNPADKINRPKKNGFLPSFYDKDEINRLFDCVQGLIIEAPMKLAAFYGLRRSEVLGLKWNAMLRGLGLTEGADSNPEKEKD